MEDSTSVPTEGSSDGSGNGHSEGNNDGGNLKDKSDAIRSGGWNLYSLYEK
jgi:hypothetical protein